ncbi:HAD family hydrolase [Cohnella sp. GCM10027633]|uniref:HAD family hydrolase n=1 Tax=unclassified Cohnella TaxID=2636738 RepID=UPI0036356019
MKRKITGIIFDMDNTLLRSRIDFPTMKQETYRFLVVNEILNDNYELSRHTTSTLIEEAVRTNRMTEEVLKEMWEIPTKHEILGMLGADLEPGTREILTQLKGRYRIAIVTNNSMEAAKVALRDNNILDCFDLIVGRERMNALKPSPDGYLRVLDEFKCSADECLSVGDSWIDGKASNSAGIRFIAYRSDKDKLTQMNVTADAVISDLNELTTILKRIDKET